jgi:hypothetical protein
MRPRVIAGLIVAGLLAALIGAGPAAAADTLIHGKVTDTKGQALEGIEVCGTTYTARPYSVCRRTDSLGQYALPETNTGGWVVDFFSPDNQGPGPGYAPQGYPGNGGLPPTVTEAQREAGVDAVMQPGVEVRGRVFSSRDHVPIQGVEACPGLGRSNFCDQTDANGEFVLRSLSPGETLLHVITAGDVNFVNTTYTTPALAGGTTDSPTISMDPGVEITGVVTDDTTGLGVERGRSGLLPTRVCAVMWQTHRPIKCVVPGVGGAYSLPGVPAGQVFAVAFAPFETVNVIGQMEAWGTGFVTQYWRCVATLPQALPLTGAPEETFSGIDASLQRVALDPPFEEPPAGPPKCVEAGGGGGSTVGGAGSNPQGGSVAIPQVTAPILHPGPKRACRKGFRRVHRAGHARCVKIHRKHRARHHR